MLDKNCVAAIQVLQKNKLIHLKLAGHTTITPPVQPWASKPSSLYTLLSKLAQASPVPTLNMFATDIVPILNDEKQSRDALDCLLELCKQSVLVPGSNADPIPVFVQAIQANTPVADTNLLTQDVALIEALLVDTAYFVLSGRRSGRQQNILFQNRARPQNVVIALVSVYSIFIQYGAPNVPYRTFCAIVSAKEFGKNAITTLQQATSADAKQLASAGIIANAEVASAFAAIYLTSAIFCPKASAEALRHPPGKGNSSSALTIITTLSDLLFSVHAFLQPTPPPNETDAATQFITTLVTYMTTLTSSAPDTLYHVNQLFCEACCVAINWPAKVRPKLPGHGVSRWISALRTICH